MSEFWVRIAIITNVILVATLSFLLVRRLWLGVSRPRISGAVNVPVDQSPARATAQKKDSDPGQARLRQEVRSASTCLILAAVLGIMFWACLGLSLVVKDPVGAPTPDEVVLCLGTGIVVLSLAGFMIWGGKNLNAVRRHEICVAASIVAILPWAGIAWLVSLPVGIWVFHLLKREPVRDLFLMDDPDS